jgi:hypothetical protein
VITADCPVGVRRRRRRRLAVAAVGGGLLAASAVYGSTFTTGKCAAPTPHTLAKPEPDRQILLESVELGAPAEREPPPAPTEHVVMGRRRR